MVCGILAPQPGIESMPLAGQRKPGILTIGPPANFPLILLKHKLGSFFPWALFLRVNCQ